MKPRARGAMVAAAGTLLFTGFMPAAALGVGLTFPTVATAIDQLQVRFEDQEQTRPALVSWRTTGEVDSGPVTLVKDLTLGETRYVDRSQLGAAVRRDYPISLQAVWHTPYCGDSSGAARWIHGSDFIGRGRAWAGLKPTELDFTGFRQSNAPDGSKLQWAEFGVGGVNRYPPQSPKPGGHMEGRVLGTTEHRVEWFDPSESCFNFGVRRVTQDVSVSSVAIEAVGGDVTFQGDEELPEVSVPVAGGNANVVRGFAIFYEGLPGLFGTVPGIEIGVDTALAAEEDGTNARLRILPHVSNAGVWHQTTRTPIGSDWQLRFTVLSYTETIDFGSREMGNVKLFPGQRALVVTRGEDGDRAQTFQAEGLSELRIGQDRARLLELNHEGGTPYPELNSCGLDQPANGFPVDQPPPPADPGDGVSIRTPGVGDPELPHAIPTGWLGFNLGTDGAGILTLEDVTVGGHTFGELSLPYVSVDGTLHPLSTEKMVEGPIVFERQYSGGSLEAGGISYDTLMLGAVFRVAGIDLPLYWIFHAKVMGDSRGIGGCAIAGPLLSEVLNVDEREIRLVWLARVNLDGRQESYARTFQLGAGYQPVPEEKTFKPVLGVIDSDNFIGLRDKQDPELRFMAQRWDGLGRVSLIRYHGTKPSDPETEVDGEAINGVDLGYTMVETRTDPILSERPYLVYPCGPCGSF